MTTTPTTPTPTAQAQAVPMEQPNADITLGRIRTDHHAGAHTTGGGWVLDPSTMGVERREGTETRCHHLTSVYRARVQEWADTATVRVRLAMHDNPDDSYSIVEFLGSNGWAELMSPSVVEWFYAVPGEADDAATLAAMQARADELALEAAQILL